MKKLSLILGVFAAAFIALAGAPEVGAATDWSSTNSLPCAGGAVCTDTEYTLTSDISLTGLIMYDGRTNITDITIDLNGHNITMDNAIAVLRGSSLTIKDSVGGGYIKSSGDARGVVYVQSANFTMESGSLIYTANTCAGVGNGSCGIIVAKTVETDAIGSTSVVVGENAVLQYEAPGYGYGVTIDKDGVTNTSYGVTAVINGSVEGGVYVNGSIQHKSNAPQITIGSTAELIGVGTDWPGIYAAGYANWVIEDGATVTGEGSAVAIKAGTMLIKGGSFTATGADSTPTTGWSNGVNASGATIQIESNASYAGDIELTILGGTFVSENGRVFYEYLADNATDTVVSELAINGGSFTSDAGKDVFMVSQEFADAITGFVHGGSFSSDPSAYAADGVIFAQNADGTYSTINTGVDVDGTNNTIDTNPETGDSTILIATGAGMLGLVVLSAGIGLIRSRR